MQGQDLLPPRLETFLHELPPFIGTDIAGGTPWEEHFPFDPSWNDVSSFIVSVVVSKNRNPRKHEIYIEFSLFFSFNQRHSV